MRTGSSSSSSRTSARPAKDVITPVDENPLDLRLAFITYVDSFWAAR